MVERRSSCCFSFSRSPRTTAPRRHRRRQSTNIRSTVPPTVVKRLATRFSLGAFAGRFEETPLGAVREAVGEGTIQHQGDAGGSIYWLCYRRAQHRLWVVSSGEMGGPDHLVTEIVEELTEKDTETSTDCAVIPKKFAPLVFDGKLH